MKNKTLQLCIIFGILVCLGIGIYIVILFMIQKQVAVVDETENQNQQQVDYVEANSSLQSLLADITPSMNQISGHLVASDGAVSFLESIESLARENNLTVVVNSITTTDANPKDTFQWLQISISTEGSWASSYHFLNMLQALPYKTMLGKISLTHNVVTDTTGTGKNTKPFNKGVWDGNVTFSVLQLK